MIGIAVILTAIGHWQSQDLVRFTAYLAIALVTSGLKVVLPGINGTMSVSFLFILIGVLELSFSETVVIGCAATLVQCFEPDQLVELFAVIGILTGMARMLLATGFITRTCEMA